MTELEIVTRQIMHRIALCMLHFTGLVECAVHLHSSVLFTAGCKHAESWAAAPTNIRSITSAVSKIVGVEI